MHITHMFSPTLGCGLVRYRPYVFAVLPTKLFQQYMTTTLTPGCTAAVVLLISEEFVSTPLSMEQLHLLLARAGSTEAVLLPVYHGLTVEKVTEMEASSRSSDNAQLQWAQGGAALSALARVPGCIWLDHVRYSTSAPLHIIPSDLHAPYTSTNQRVVCMLSTLCLQATKLMSFKMINANCQCCRFCVKLPCSRVPRVSKLCVPS
jgi:hypothetical protein